MIIIVIFLQHFLQNKGSPSVYGEITSRGEREEKELNATDGFEIESFDKVLQQYSINLSYKTGYQYYVCKCTIT